MCFEYHPLHVIPAARSHPPCAAAFTVEHNLPGLWRVRCRRRREPGWSEGRSAGGPPKQHGSRRASG